MKVISEVPETAYFPIEKPLIKNAKNKKVPMEGEEEIRITPKATPCKNINELQAKGCEVDDDNCTVPDTIPNPDTQK